MAESNVTTLPQPPEALKVDRETASRINPLIGSCWTEDTLRNVSHVIRELGYLMAGTEMATENMYHVFGAAAAALSWEGENIHSLAAGKKAREAA